MQLKAYVTCNGSMPQRSILTYVFDSGKVSDLCSFAAEQCSCPPGVSFKVTMKIPGDSEPWWVAPGIALEDGSEYLIIIEVPPANGSFAQSTQSSPMPPAVSQSPPTTPCNSQDNLDKSVASQVMPTSSTSTLHSVPSNADSAATAVATVPRNPVDEAVSMDDLNAVIAASTPSSAAEAGVLPHNALLVAVYYKDREDIEACYAEMKPSVPCVINNVDVHASFGHPARKTALYILKYSPGKNKEVEASAKFVCKKALVQILVDAFPDFVCSSKAIQPACDFLAQSTGNDFFLNLTTTNGSNLIMNAFRQRQRRLLETQNPRDPGTPKLSAKKRKVVHYVDREDIETAAVALASCTSAKETKQIVSQTAQLRCSWIKNMEQENAPQIPETFIKKFPCFIGDASLLNEDYKCNMQLRGLAPVDFGDTFNQMIPAIFNLAVARNVLPANTPRPLDPDTTALLACKLLINLVPKYCKRNGTCKPERLFAEGYDTTCLNALHQQRRQMKQIAPMIFIITAYPALKNIYYVATDDFALKVPGSFSDALESLMEIHYIFDLAYAKELRPFFGLLEKFAKVETSKTYSTLNDLYVDLVAEADNLDAEKQTNQQNPDDAQQNPGHDTNQQQSPREPGVADLG